MDATILNAAQTLLQEVGEQFTIAQLADKTKRSRATLYRQIGSKEALLQHLAQERGLEVELLSDMRARILHSARQVFARQGLINTTMEQIATEAGVGVATVYRHFGDKESLMRAFVTTLSPLMAVQGVTMHPTEDVVGDLMQIVGALLPFAHANRDLLRFSLSANSAEQDYIRQFRDSTGRTLDRLATYIADQQKAGRIRDDADPQRLALALAGMIFGFTLFGPAHYGIPLNNPEETSQLIATLFWRGITPEEL